MIKKRTPSGAFFTAVMALFLVPTLQRGNAYFLDIPLSAAGRILFVLIQKGFKKIKYAVMQTNER